MDTYPAPSPSAPTHPGLARYAQHSPATDPGRHARLLAAVGTGPDALHRAATRTILHYRSQATRLTASQLPDVDARTVAAILDRASARRPGPLTDTRPDACAVAGCCRDRALLAVAALREHGVPARTRLGFAAYLGDDYRYDHVVGERWDGARWVRFDPGVVPGSVPFDVHDLPTGAGAPFETAAEAWLAYRAGGADLARHGAGPDLPGLAGPAMVQRYVLGDLAHRMLCETLLWDVWGAMAPPWHDVPDAKATALADEVARLTVAADASGLADDAAGAALADLWACEPRLRPGDVVLSLSPVAAPAWADLR